MSKIGRDVTEKKVRDQEFKRHSVPMNLDITITKEDLTVPHYPHGIQWYTSSKGSFIKKRIRETLKRKHPGLVLTDVISTQTITPRGAVPKTLRCLITVKVRKR